MLLCSVGHLIIASCPPADFRGVLGISSAWAVFVFAVPEGEHGGASVWNGGSEEASGFIIQLGLDGPFLLGVVQVSLWCAVGASIIANIMVPYPL